MLKPKHVRLVQSVLMSALMVTIMTAVITALNTGFGTGFLTRWMTAWLFACPIAFGVILIAGKRVQQLAMEMCGVKP